MKKINISKSKKNMIDKTPEKADKEPDIMKFKGACKKTRGMDASEYVRQLRDNDRL